MKKYLLHFCLLAFALLSLCGCDNLKYAELYEITDEFVEELHTNVESYGLLGGVDDTEYTDDGVFRVLPMGRLINVKIEHDATDEEYEALREALESHYVDDQRVTEVYRCRAGTIMIDCRHCGETGACSSQTDASSRPEQPMCTLRSPQQLLWLALCVHNAQPCRARRSTGRA